MIRFAVDHPVATWMLFTALIVTGVYAVPRLNIEAMPETDLPELSISTYWNGASPSAIQRSITLPIEEAAAGDAAVLLGRQGDEIITPEMLADLLGTIPYEVLTLPGPTWTRIPV